MRPRREADKHHIQPTAQVRCRRQRRPTPSLCPSTCALFSWL